MDNSLSSAEDFRLAKDANAFQETKESVSPDDKKKKKRKREKNPRSSKDEKLE